MPQNFPFFAAPYQKPCYNAIVLMDRVYFTRALDSGVACYKNQNHLIPSLALAFSFPSGEPINLFLYLIKSKPDTSYTRTYLLMRIQCLMFMLLLAASTAVTQELYLDEKTISHVNAIVSLMYGSYTRVIS